MEGIDQRREGEQAVIGSPKKSGLLWVVFLMFWWMTPAIWAVGESSLVIRQISGAAEISPGSGYTETDLFSDFKNLLPGDVRTEIITVQNQCEGRKPLRLSLKALPHDPSGNPLSPAVAASETIDRAADFLSQLQMKVWVRETLVFQDQADVGLDGIIPLGSLPYDGSMKLKVELSVPLTMGNEYAGRMGEIDWIFLLEDESGVQPDDPDHLIQTGQPRWIPALLAGGGALLILFGLWMRRRHETEKNR